MKGMPVEIIKHSYLQTANNEQQRMNRKCNYGIKTYSTTINDKRAGRIVGATLGPRKVKKIAPTSDARPQPCKVEVNKSKQQAPTGPTADAGPQPCKVEPNNNKQQLMN